MYVLKTFIILYVLSFFCFGVFSAERFKEESALRWINLDGLENIHGLSQESALKSPKNTWITVLEIYFYNEKFQKVKDCLLYKVPESGGDGVLKVVSGFKGDEKCKKVKFNPALFTKDKIFNFIIPSSHNAFVYLVTGEIKIGNKKHDQLQNSNLICLQNGNDLKISAIKKSKFLSF